jgi:hypothetical protein
MQAGYLHCTRKAPSLRPQSKRAKVELRAPETILDLVEALDIVDQEDEDFRLTGIPPKANFVALGGRDAVPGRSVGRGGRGGDGRCVAVGPGCKTRFVILLVYAATLFPLFL